MNATKANVNNEGKTFEEVLRGMMGEAEKKLAMFFAVEDAKAEMHEELQAMGDMVMGSMEVEQCPCERNCGVVRITAEFRALTFTPHGIEVKEGKMEKIITMKEVE